MVEDPGHTVKEGFTLTKDEIALEEKLRNLPAKPGVYQFRSASGDMLYVGKAVNLRNRVRQYFQKSHQFDPRLEMMVSKIHDVELIVTDSEVEALILETSLIQELKPRYNIDLKDDKSYPYVVVTNEPFPRVFATRRVIRDGSRYFGPYTEVKNMHSSLKMIREIYRVRSCNYFIDDDSIRKKKIKVCLDYHIKKCEGPCEGLVSREKYNAMINEVVQVLKGKTTSLVRSLEEQMTRASEEMRYEAAGEMRDKIRQLKVYDERQKIIDPDMIDRDLFAVAAEGNDGCGIVFKVRDGKIIGRQHFYMTGVEGREEPEIVEQFLDRYYLHADEIPSEIFLSSEIENSEAVESWLARRRNDKVRIVVPKIGDKAKLMAMCRRNAQFLLDMLRTEREKQKDAIPYAVKALQKDLRLANAPRRIECFDISNIQGADSVASMVVFVDGRPRKSEYRKFKVRSVEGPDDFASMREVIDRRYSRVLEEQGSLPDLLVVDGGKGQLSSALDVLERLHLREPRMTIRRASDPPRAIPGPTTEDGGGVRNLPVIGLAKRLEEVFIPGSQDPQSIPKSSSGLKLLQRIRDEAHRFAIMYHRTVRSKRTLRTELDLIEGIGKKRAKELLETFGSVQGVKFATEEQLAEVVGEKVAAKIKEYFSDDEPLDSTSVDGVSAAEPRTPNTSLSSA
jgi:excinuclease ABC subunit C